MYITCLICQQHVCQWPQELCQVKKGLRNCVSACSDFLVWPRQDVQHANIQYLTCYLLYCVDTRKQQMLKNDCKREKIIAQMQRCSS